MPRYDETFYRLGGARMFSKLYLKTGFHETRVLPGDIEKTVLKKSTEY